MLPKGRDRAPGDAQATAVPFRRLVFVPAVRQDAHTPAPHAGLVLLNPEQQVRGAMLITSKMICIKWYFDSFYAILPQMAPVVAVPGGAAAGAPRAARRGAPAPDEALNLSWAVPRRAVRPAEACVLAR